MVTSTKKRGRPVHVYRMANGTQIPGLMKLKDGRWRASGPEKFTFSESDEGRAVQRFYEWKSKREKAVLMIPQAAAPSGDADGVRQAIATVVPAKVKRRHRTPAEEWHETFVPSEHPE